MRYPRPYLAALASLLALGAAPSLANDGRNRYEGSVPSELVHLHGPVSPQAGFRVLAADMPGGADGDPAFRWATRPAVALVRLASRRVAEALGGPGPYPLAIFDLSSENGDTPIEFDAQGRPHGRHPGGSHDGGANLDLGYYLTSEVGRVETPDPAACTDHFKPDTPAGQPLVDDRMCHGPADRLDVARQALFLLEITRTHRERFGGELLECIGIDARVRTAVLAQARDWVRAKRFGASGALVAEMARLFASSPYDGWAHTHHHHVHVRLLPMDPGARHAADIARLVDADRALEARLLAGDATAEGCALVTELSSVALARSIDARLVPTSAAAHCPALKRLRLDGGAWEAPEDPLEPAHHVFDAPARPAFSTALVEAELADADGSTRVIRRTVALPAQKSWLRVRVEPSHFVGRVKRDGDAWLLLLDFPPVDAVLVDHVSFVVHRRGEAEPTIVAVPTEAASARIPAADAIDSVEAEIGLSGRVRWRVPVLATPR